MNIDVPSAFSCATRPPLPTPNRARWQPLRLGLIDLFHYDSEEFWFRDGHLLLRGNNGTGKSKVLSLTLPFLFDAQLKSSRIEPDGDASKKMSWNLLLGKYDRRMGYAWIEFGRLGEDEQPQYFSLGCGLSAVAARSQVDSWFFVLGGRRIGLDLWLTTPQRVVLTKERLKDVLGDHGQVFETAMAYRRAVDERLFQLGTARYSALMDTLIQLRQPQLSKKPDEGSLSDALTEAFPPLSTDLLGDVADALNQLEEDRRQLRDYEALAEAVGQFNRRYRVYASTQTRRQARGLRSAQTGFDNASRALNEARSELEAAQKAEAQAVTEHQVADTALRASRARLQVLQSDPVNTDANRLDLAAREADDRQRDASQAELTENQSNSRLAREIQATSDRVARTAQIEGALSKVRLQALDFARTSGVGDPWTLNPLSSSGVAELTALDPRVLESARDDLHQTLARRREQVVLLRQRRADMDQAEQEHTRKIQTRDERDDETKAAATRRQDADSKVERQGRALLDAWQIHFDGLQQLSLSDVQTPLHLLAQWVATLQGENPARVALQAAQQQTSERLARRYSELSYEQQELQAEEAALKAERDRLEQGEDAAPAIPPFRAPYTRIDRAGGPLWQVVDFHDDVGEAQRAGLEAALEASGLLDAWVTPDGRLHTADGAPPLQDTQVVERLHRDISLAAWLQPSGSLVDAATVVNLLQGMACTTVDYGTEETWLSIDGRFRIGALAGAWNKPVATYIGYAARAAARARRIEAIALRLSELAHALTELQSRFDEHAQHRKQAASEWQGAPTDDVLRTAHADAASCEREFQTASSRLQQAEQQLSEAAKILHTTREALARDAQDLRLPDTHHALNLVEQALTELGETMHGLVHTAQEMRQAQTELQRQREREQEAQVAAESSAKQSKQRRVQADEAAVRLQTLRESVGAKVDELQRRLKEAHESVSAGEKLEETKDEAMRLAGETRARAEQRVSGTQGTLEERSASRQQAIARLQGFAATDLLSVALPELDVPDLRTPWTIEPALNLARRAEQALSSIQDDDDSWRRIQSRLSQDYTELGSALTALSHQAQMEQTADYGLVVTIVYQNRPERPDRLTIKLDAEIAQRRELLTAREREVLENHLQAEIAAAVQRLLQEAERQVDAINTELYKRPTSTGVRFRLQWQPVPEGADGAPVGLEAARKRLLNTSSDLWSPEDRRVVGAMLQQRIETERTHADAAIGGSLFDQLARALDYRRWHRFSVQRWQDGQWRKLSGPASSGERALGLTVPLFAAVASYYGQSNYPYSPRLVLLDEVFAGIDDAARAYCMGLIREFDLDFVVTSEREWGCYAELPGVSICQLLRHEGIDAVHVSRWTWDGHAKHREDDPNRRFADA
jgi:uncharacterized protein (TIGR02680 family)